jgi:hypothetical protein
MSRREEFRVYASIALDFFGTTAKWPCTRPQSLPGAYGHFPRIDARSILHH